MRRPLHILTQILCLLLVLAMGASPAFARGGTTRGKASPRVRVEKQATEKTTGKVRPETRLKLRTPAGLLQKTGLRKVRAPGATLDTRRADRAKRAQARKEARSKRHSRIRERVTKAAGTSVALAAQGAFLIQRFSPVTRISSSMALNVVAPFTLMVGSTYGLINAKTWAQRVDAIHGYFWAGQIGLGVLGKSQAAMVGVAGGTIQGGMGVYRLWTGLRDRKRSTTITGALDLTAGSAWVASSLQVATTASLSIFVTATAIKMAYDNRGTIKLVGNKLGEWRKRTLGDGT